MSAAKPPRGLSRGFSLIEALVAVAVAAAGVAAIVETVQGQSRARRAAGELARLTVLAEAEVARGRFRAPGAHEGAEAGLAWSAVIEEIGPRRRAIVVTATAPSGRRLVLAAEAVDAPPAEVDPP